MLHHLRRSSARSVSLLQQYGQELGLGPVAQQVATRTFQASARASDHPSDYRSSNVTIPFPILGFFRYVSGGMARSGGQLLAERYEDLTTCTCIVKMCPVITQTFGRAVATGGAMQLLRRIRGAIQ